jgi:hypothetical protein
MNERTPPRIYLDYQLKDKALDWTMEFFYALNEYALNRPDEEKVGWFTEYRQGSLFVKLGKNVLDKVCYAEIEHEVEVAHEAIIDGRKGEARTVFERSFVGRQLSGDLPDPE